MNTQPTGYEIEIAALLHDIGKFLQRAGYIQDRPKNLHDYCPSDNNGGYTHLHTADTVQFIEKFRDILPDEINYAVVRDLAGKHHLAQSSFEWIIAIADRVSAGTDRPDKQEDDTSTNKGHYITTPLNEVFQRISFQDQNAKKASILKKYPLKRLSPQKETIFPGNHEKVQKKDYADLWKAFEHDIASLKGLPVDSFIETLNSILLHYTWCIPSSTQIKEEADVSLYDHLRTTAAFASALFKYHEELGSLENIQAIQNNTKEIFLFVSGDLSGIQSYIFDLKKSKFSAKMLRAKSFQLQILSDFYIKRLLEDLGLSSSCKIMDAGGRFLCVLPNTPKTVEYLESFRKEVDSYFLSTFFGELSLNISTGVALSSDDLKQQNMQGVFQKIQNDIAAAKQRKFQSVLKKTEDYVFSKEYNQIERADQVCGYCEKRKVEDTPFNVQQESVFMCKSCESLLKLGTKIPKAHYLGWRETEVPEKKPDLRNFGFYTMENKVDSLAMPYTVNAYSPSYPVRYLPFYLPTRADNDDVLTFKDLGEASEGNEKIAMVKMDVDNLGALFSIGLGKNVSISRFATMSRMLDFFFSGYLNNLIQNTKEYRNLYTVFSGGDDVCIIGPWNVVLDFSKKLQSDFTEYVSSNPEISISAGIALANSNLPVDKLAYSAEELLERSKHEANKSSISLFSSTVDWKNFSGSIELGEYFYSAEKTLSISLIYSLLTYIEMKKALDRGEEIGRNGLWISHLRYRTARLLPDARVREEFLSRILPLFETEKKQNTLIIAIHYALYKKRLGGK